MDQQPARQLTSRFFNQITLFMLAIFSINLQAGSSTTSHFILPPNHQSDYLIEKFSTDVGNMQNELHYENGVITYTSTATAKGLAALFIDAKPKETSILNWPDDNTKVLPRQQNYHYFQKKKHKKNQQMTFDYNNAEKVEIKGRYKNKDYTIESAQPVWTRQFLPLLMSNDLQQNPNITSNSFFISNKGHIQKYTYTLESNESIKYHDEIFAVIKFKIIREGSSRMSYAWLSKAHFYLPLKIEQYKDGDLNARLLLTNLKLK